LLPLPLKTNSAISARDTGSVLAHYQGGPPRRIVADRDLRQVTFIYLRRRILEIDGGSGYLTASLAEEAKLLESHKLSSRR
jgi:hypothetical protein